MALDSTVGTSTANSYVSVADADSYFEMVPEGATWLGLLTEDKEVYLVRATKRLDQLKWGGKPTNPTQSLQYPRDFIKNRYYDYLEYGYQTGDFYWEGGENDAYYYPNDEIPQAIKDACCELAFHYYKIDQEEYDLTEHQYDTYSSINVGGMSITLKNGLTADRLPKHVKRLLKTFSSNGWVQAGQPKLVRG